MADEVRIMRARRDNPDLPKEFVKQALEAKIDLSDEKVDLSEEKLEPYVRETKKGPI